MCCAPRQDWVCVWQKRATLVALSKSKQCQADVNKTKEAEYETVE